MKEFGEATACVIGIVFVVTFFLCLMVTMTAWRDEVLCEAEHDVYSCVKVYVPEMME